MMAFLRHEPKWGPHSKGAADVTAAPRVLYQIVCGVSNAATAYNFIRDVQADGWEVCVITTPSGAGFVDIEQLAALTGHPVRSSFKNLGAPDVLPPPNAVVVAPASFNTVNKISNGISDTLAVGIVCEAIGKRLPVVIAPWMNRALANHRAYARSIVDLSDSGVRVVLTERTKPGEVADDTDEPFPWNDVLLAVRKLRVEHALDNA